MIRPAGSHRVQTVTDVEGGSAHVLHGVTGRECPRPGHYFGQVSGGCGRPIEFLEG